MTDDHGIAGTAHDLVYGERAKTYGHPKIDFSIIANIWTGLMKDKLREGEELDAYRVAVLMTGLKLARLVQSPQHTDSRIDTIGYMLTMERLDEVEDAPPVYWEKKLITYPPSSPNDPADAVPLTLHEKATQELDKLLAGNQHTLYKSNIPPESPVTDPHHPVNVVLRGFLPVEEIQWSEGDRIEMLNDPSIAWLYSRHADQWYWVTTYSPATGQLYNSWSDPDDFANLRTEHSPLVVTIGAYKGLLILKDGVGYVAER
jgi:hypothetical protein